MQTIVCLGVLLLLVSLAQTNPAYDEPLRVDVDTLLAAAQPANELNRQKRATCDLLSAFNVNHSACAVHCIAKGFMGGFCNGKAVCVCRR